MTYRWRRPYVSASRLCSAALLVGALTVGMLPAAAAPKDSTSAFARFSELGPENHAMALHAGIWNMSETIWAAPGAAPVTTTGLVATRRMVGSMLQEFLHSPSDVSGTAVKRIDYLSFNRVEGRWEYVSMDLRAPVGIMTAQSFTNGADGRIDLRFQPFAYVGGGPNVSGQMLRMEEVITRQGPDRDTKEQYFQLADGTGTRWLAHRYTYTRKV